MFQKYFNNQTLKHFVFDIVNQNRKIKNQSPVPSMHI